MMNMYNNPEMTKLICLLAKADIPFELIAWECNEKPTLQIAHPNKAHSVVDAVSHEYSYGGKQGLIEVLGSVNPNCPNEDVRGWLTAEEAFCYFVNKEVE